MILDKIFTQKMFADQLGSRLTGWRVQSYSPYRANFRCPICGDSEKNRFKKRGYILERSGYLVYYCHNACGTIGFEKYLRDYHQDLFSMYRLELLRQKDYDDIEEPVDEIEKEITVDEIELDNFQVNRDAYSYIKSRQISEKFWDDIYYTSHFYKYINSVVPNKFPDSYLEYKDRRIIFPLRTFDGNIFGVIGRAIDKNNRLRYITIKYDETAPKFFGLDRVNRANDVYILEGPIDTFHIDNAVALAGTDGDPTNLFNSDQFIMVLDNQPRAKDVIKKYEKYIDLGYRMVIWPSNIKEKDPNEMIVSGRFNEPMLNKIIRNNTYSGLMLKIRFNTWRKI